MKLEHDERQETKSSAATKLDDTPHGRFRCYSMVELDGLDLAVDYLFRDVLVADTPGVIGGREKTLKTQIALDCGVSMATYTPWLGRFEPVRAARLVYFTGEGGLTFLRESLRRIAASKGLTLRQVPGFSIVDAVPNLNSDRDMRAVTEILRDCEAEFGFFDPLYLMMADKAASASNVFAMGFMLQRMLDACREAGATPIVLHHFRKSQTIGESPDLSDLSQSGCAEFAGQWLLANRQRPYDEERPGEHDLIIRLGSRMGFSSKWALRVSEGSTTSPEGRYWDPQLSPPAEARKEAETAKELARQQKEAKQREENGERIIRAMTRLGGVRSRTRIKEESGSPRGFDAAFTRLLEEGCVVTGDIFVSNHKTPQTGYSLAT
jgi:hypothetical protein